MEKHRMGQNVEWKNTEWDKTSNEKKVEWDKMSNGNMVRKICVNIFFIFITTKLYILIIIIFTLMFMYFLKIPLDTICIVMSKMVKNVENVRKWEKSAQGHMDVDTDRDT